MSDLSTIDKNFVIETKNHKKDIKYYNALNEPFRIYGVYHDDGKFRRMPEAVAEKVSKGVHSLHACTAGGRVRFKTNSPYIAIFAEMGRIEKSPHFPFTGSSGFDIYIKRDGKDSYFQTLTPSFDMKDKYEAWKDFGFEDEKNSEKEVTINFPLYSEVVSLHIGLAETATLSAPEEYSNPNKIIFYGSSITQGGCASRAGTSYEGFISRRFDCDYINLGFSGSAGGEETIARYIAGLDMSVFVYDYDHNAPDAEFLRNSHERMFKIIREAHPNLPVIMITRPEFYQTDKAKEHFKVIRETYDNAVKAGDENVYFISGRDLMLMTNNEGTVDNCHPTDLGFFAMALGIGDVIEEIFRKNENK